MTRTDSKIESPKPIFELKHPGLKGLFPCGSCNSVFAHSTSLNRHRMKCNRHFCLLCDKTISKDENVRDHMKSQHKISNIYVCGCCVHSFTDKKSLFEHTESMRKTGTSATPSPVAMALKMNEEIASYKKSGSLSPTTSLSRTATEESSNGSRSPSPADVPVMEVKKEVIPKNQTLSNEDANAKLKKLFDKAVDMILQSKVFSDEQIVLPETWQTIVDTAKQMLAAYVENFMKTGKVMPLVMPLIKSTNTSRKRPAKRPRVE